jgi:putative DNA primase/helicase
MNDFAEQTLLDLNTGACTLDNALTILAREGFVLLPNNSKTPAKGGTFKPDALLLPHDLEAFGSLDAAKKAGQDVFPRWFGFDESKGMFTYTEQDLVKAFINHFQMEKQDGDFIMRGERVTPDTVKAALLESLSIVRSNPGGKLYSTFSTLSAMCPSADIGQSPASSGSRGKARLTLTALDLELHAHGYAIRHNLITGKYEITGNDTGSPMTTDKLVTYMHNALSDGYRGATFEVLRNYISYIAEENCFNPVLTELESIEWDQQDRLPQLYALLGIEHDALSKTLVRKWLYQTVALLFNGQNGEKMFGADGCLVFNGAQGAGKTSFFRHLALKDEWFGEGCSIDDHDKDTVRRVITKWITELGEVESTLKSDISKLKAFVSLPFDAYRLQYGHADIEAPRHASLCATCNSDRYLIDPTGNRRWWSVPFNRTIPRAELEALDARQLWAQVFTLVKALPYEEKASCFRLTVEEQKALAIRNGEYEKPQKGQLEVEDILTRADRDALTWKSMTISEFKTMWDVLRPYSAQQISAAVKACGVEIKRTKHGACADLPTPSPSGNPF